MVPFDYDLAANPQHIEYEGIFISNGPGDPQDCVQTIASVRWAMSGAIQPPKPIFGICLGNQILGLACGASTYKMKYGNRGMNQPCIDLRTTKCYITSQNHGYAVDSNSLPSRDWKTLFLNANDLSNEGIIHTSKPFFSVQFHPEACGGPYDTKFLFSDFIEMVRGTVPERVLVEPALYERSAIRKVLLPPPLLLLLTTTYYCRLITGSAHWQRRTVDRPGRRVRLLGLAGWAPLPHPSSPFS